MWLREPQPPVRPKHTVNPVAEALEATQFKKD